MWPPLCFPFKLGTIAFDMILSGTLTMVAQNKCRSDVDDSSSKQPTNADRSQISTL